MLLLGSAVATFGIMRCYMRYQFMQSCARYAACARALWRSCEHSDLELWFWMSEDSLGGRCSVEGGPPLGADVGDSG